MRVPFGSLPDTILETILGAFGVPLGSLGASLWEKMGFGKASKKWSEKQECGEVRGNSRKPGSDPVRPYKPSFLEPSGTFWEPCGTSLDHFDHFESMFLCITASLHSTSCLGHGGGYNPGGPRALCVSHTDI